RKNDAIHWHFPEVGMGAIGRIEPGRTFQSVGKPAELLAHGWRAGGERPRGYMPIKISPTSHRTLAPDVEGGERIHLPGVGSTDDHAELLLYGRIGSRRLHATVFQG